MKHKLATTMLVVAGLVVATFSATTTTRPALADEPFPINGCPASSDPMVTVPTKPPCADDDVILRWDEQLLAAVRANPPATGPTVTSRALGVLHTATYDAWSAYDPVAKATLPNGNKEQPANDADKSKAISFAAYKTLVNLFPYNKSEFDKEMVTNLHYKIDGSDTTAPALTGTRAAQAVINYRSTDNSNQSSPDSTGKVSYPCTAPATPPTPCPYQPKRQWYEDTLPWHWQPLCVPLTATCKPVNTSSTAPLPQSPLTPQWGNVKSFSSLTALELKVMPPPQTTTDIDTALADTDLSGPDGDAKKVKAEYWADGPQSEFPPGHMAVFAQYLSRKNHFTLDQDAKMFFALGNAVMDAGIAAWWVKYKYDFWRPITAIRYQYNSTRTTKKVWSWLGPNKGFDWVNGEQWMPYQLPSVVTPAFPEYVSGHSTFSAAGNVIMTGFTGSDNFGGGVTIPENWSKFETGVPAAPVPLYWPTFTAMADEAGMSRRSGGIHFKTGDIQGRALGNGVGQSVWSKAQSYFRGTIGFNY
jgi:PAP2 superfamily